MKLAAVFERQRDGIRICALFAAFTILSFGILYLTQTGLIVPLNRHFAWMSEKMLRVVGVPAVPSGRS